MDPALAALHAGLARADLRLDEAIERFASSRRTDLTGLPSGAAARLLTVAAERLGPTLVVTGDSESARRAAEDLRFFHPRPHEVLYFPALDTTPFLDVAPDRRAAMDRLAVLFHVAKELPWRFLVAPAPALLRRLPPREAITARSLVVEAETELERDDLVDVLIAGGYMKAPVAEDPGTFAVRGGIVDIYPPHARYPARIELDDWLVASIKLFDPDDQRTIESVTRMFVHPVRDTVLTDKDRARALAHIRELCDGANVPTKKTRALLEELESGRAFYGLDGFLPAFYDRLETLFDYLPADAPVAILDPTDVAKAAHVELMRAGDDREAKALDGAPAYPLEALYLDDVEAYERITARRHVVVHRLAVLGSHPEEDGPLARFEHVREDEAPSLGAEDQSPLVAELKALRAVGTDDGLRPVAERAHRWLDMGLRVLFTARTHTQAERLVSLLRGCDVPVDPKPEPFDPSLLGARSGEGRAKARVVIGELQDGFAWATEGLVIVTEGEIFGTRARRQQKASKRKSRKAEAFLEDLRELKVGDYVVHADHGVGVYLGIERKPQPQSPMEVMRGEPPRVVEALIVEYAGGDKLFLPVTRLTQLQKFAGQDGAKPKLDRLGGSTFAKKKQKVRTEVAHLADELLKLYAQRAAAARPALPPTDRSYAEFEATFPFEETPDQARAIEEVLSDLEETRPMDRLVCGDVGFGKTEVAIRAAFRVAMAGRQVAVLCPTTVLAQQHYLNFKARFEGYPLNVASLSRFTTKEESAATLAGLKAGTVDVVIGTHRLLSKDVHFKDIGLIVVDEEQRFGVQHKERIKKLRTDVDVLTLSATPIPRTLQLAIGGLRDLSLITTAPTDRRAVRTFACRWDDHVIKEAIQREIDRGGQIFFCYNRIEGLYERAQRIQDLLPGARVAVAHGQMKEGQLERTMTDFVGGAYDVLCSTAIIESGLDIPRANTMIVDRADMFGLAQLYQLRGRVGRSRERAYCYLVTPPPSSLTDEARVRIEALERFTELGSGFQVASLDMELRGVGDLLGAEQSGNVALVGFDLFIHMLEEAIAQLRGEEVVQEIDPEVTIDLEHYLPETYVDDVGLRLSLYKRFATAHDEDSVADLAAEMEDRFGPPPPPAAQLVRVMALRPLLRHYRALGCEATSGRVTLHLREDTPLDPRKLIPLVGTPRSPWKLSPDMKLTRRFDADEPGDAVDRVRALFTMLRPLQKGVA
ncbi:MAG: transcription-repair coupling factor [Myxococcales bacterium]|nr:transcription-repair coupling factor [Myxococcales bacterium]